MKAFVGLGSNLGDRLENLERAGTLLRQTLTASPVYETPALLPQGAQTSWDKPYLNAVVAFEWAGSPADLLKMLKKIERDMGRTPGERWAPRVIDLDILLLGDKTVDENGLQIPHPGIWDRAFVLDPLKDIAPGLKIPGKNETVLSRARKIAGRAPLWMGILNLTPDSFSDGGDLSNIETFSATVEDFAKAGVGLIDIGAESTRPGAQILTPQEEWARLKPALELLESRARGKLFRPRVSIDTHRAATAEKALGLGASCINDVSGGKDPDMISVLKQSTCDYVPMHSLSVPADKNITLPEGCDAGAAVKDWMKKKIAALGDAGISPQRLILDPGLGFGKTARQSIALLRGIDGFFDLGARVLCGHSRKSFINHWGERKADDRDFESAAISLQIAARGVDILRVHAPERHIRAWRAFASASGC